MKADMSCMQGIKEHGTHVLWLYDVAAMLHNVIGVAP